MRVCIKKFYNRNSNFFCIASVEFVDYFEDNYIGRRARNIRRRSPRFPISFWNCYTRLDQQLPRTNNSQEGWHNALQVRSCFATKSSANHLVYSDSELVS